VISHFSEGGGACFCCARWCDVDLSPDVVDLGLSLPPENLRTRLATATAEVRAKSNELQVMQDELNKVAALASSNQQDTVLSYALEYVHNDNSHSTNA